MAVATERASTKAASASRCFGWFLREGGRMGGVKAFFNQIINT